MEKNYNFSEVESKIYQLWLDNNCFKADSSSNKPPFSIVLPPPNANGNLHLGHSLGTLEDTLIRYKKMSGFEVLWVPGSDHAGFETQVVYEKNLSKEGKSRFDFERDTFYQNILNFVTENKSNMMQQLKDHGFGLDWSRETFTLDEKVIKTVYETFEKLSNDGLIYRGSRLINYCTKHGTGFSDLEVEYKEQKDFLYFIKYKLEDSEEFLTVATARPETIFVDVALCVNPEDERYKSLIGKNVLNPLTGSKMPVISDEKVEIEFGTGVLKITPLHDFNDFEISQKHGIEGKSVLNKNGKLNSNAGEFENLRVSDAREKVTLKLEELGALMSKKEYIHQVPCCYKCETVLEPMLLPQWFVKTKPLAEKAIEAVRNGDIKIHPKRFEKTYFDWLENIVDWNISRQIVWGIRIPAFECNICGKWKISKDLNPEKCDCGSTDFTQDSDTFDTWFSSGQWPFVTLGYPDSEDFKKFYPLSVLGTAYDILFFWVSRMIMLGIYVTGKVPFENVFMHGLVRDPKGQKMSKSKGNVINPSDLIKKYGADALRMSLVMGSPAGNDQNFSEPKLVGTRNFGNKLWNMARFMKMLAEDSFDIKSEMEFGDLKNLNTEMANKHIEFVELYKSKMENFNLSEVAEMVHGYIWHEIADIYIEKAKEDKNLLPLVNHIFRDSIKLLHPFMPFVTEEIWQQAYSTQKNPLIIQTDLPKY